MAKKEEVRRGAGHEHFTAKVSQRLRGACSAFRMSRMSVASLGNCSNATRTSSEVFCTGMYTHAIAQFFLLTCVLSPSLPAPYTYDSRCCSPSPCSGLVFPTVPPGQSPQQPCLSSNAKSLIHSTSDRTPSGNSNSDSETLHIQVDGWKMSCHLVPTFILVFFSSSLFSGGTQEGKKKKKKKNQFNRLCAPGPNLG